jgi:hypothetical protein
MPRIVGRFLIHAEDIGRYTRRKNLHVGQVPKSILELPEFASRYLFSEQVEDKKSEPQGRSG